MDTVKTEDIRVEHPAAGYEKANDAFNLEVHQAVTSQHSLSVAEAVKAYPMAIFWSLMVAMCVVMEGYDTIL